MRKPENPAKYPAKLANYPKLMEHPRIDSIPEGQVYTINPPVVEAMISGVSRAGFFPDGRISLIYEDGTIETGQFTIPEAQMILDGGFAAWFPIVSAVQEKRKL